MRAKSDLIPDCDIHGEPMHRDECPASVLGLEGRRDLHVWRCGHPGCGRYFYGTVGYCDNTQKGHANGRSSRCSREGAFLVAQRALGRYICPVAGCNETEPWHAAQPALAASFRR